MRGDKSPLRHPRKGFTLVELLVVIAIIAVLIGLLLPAVQRVRESSNRVMCQNNLKHLSLAALNYHEDNGGFPMGFSVDYTSPLIPLLPYVDQLPLYKQGKATTPVFSTDTPDSPGAAPVPLFACPSDAGIPTPATMQFAGTATYLGLTSYRGNASGLSNFDPDAGLDGVIVEDNGPVNIINIKDGTSNTFLFGEFCNQDPNWGDYASLFGSAALAFPTIGSSWSGTGLSALEASGYYPLNSMLPPVPSDPGTALVYAAARLLSYGSNHPGGANFAFCDGSVRFVSNGIANAPGVLSALSTRNGGEVVDANSY
jgi:prepilin-type N-terminal cleavage/methylation domain-containing protein/prepilin-type processing-associated H-X9-DG protein